MKKLCGSNRLKFKKTIREICRLTVFPFAPQVCEEWMKVREDRLNEHFSQSDFKLDQGEALLKEMQSLRDELSQYEDEVRKLRSDPTDGACCASSSILSRQFCSFRLVNFNFLSVTQTDLD